MRIDEIVERSRLLPGSQNQIAPGRTLNPVFILTAKEIVLLFLMFPGLTGVDRDPSVTPQIELGPAMISGYVGLASLVGQRETNGKAGWYSGGSREADEQSVKISTVSALGVAGEEYVATSPTLAALIIFHVGQRVVVYCARLFQICFLPLGHFRRQLSDPAVDGHQLVGIQELTYGRIQRAGNNLVHFGKIFAQIFRSAHFEFQGDRDGIGARVIYCNIERRVAEPRFGIHSRALSAGDLHVQDLLIPIGFWIWQPDLQTSGSRRSLGNFCLVGELEHSGGELGGSGNLRT